MRKLSKPSTAQCNSTLYTLYLLSEPKYVSCMRLSEILVDLSHDSVNCFLLRERYTPRDLFDEAITSHLPSRVVAAVQLERTALEKCSSLRKRSTDPSRLLSLELNAHEP